MRLALFDFDGTISSKDSFLGFLFSVAPTRVVSTALTHLYQVAAYSRGRFPNQAMKELFLEEVLGGKKLKELEEHSRHYCDHRIPKIIRPGFHSCLQEHLTQNTRVIVVSATPKFILKPWCDALKLELLATELETDSKSRLTGKISGKNCMAEEKVVRIRQLLDPDDYNQIFTYGDSSGDLPMLKLASSEKNRHYRPCR